MLKPWVPRYLLQINIDFCVDARIYCITPSSLHGLGIFSMVGIEAPDGGLIELMDYVGRCYNYINWVCLAQYTKSM